LYALEVAEFRDKQKLKQLKHSMNKIDLKNKKIVKNQSIAGNHLEQQLSATQLSSHIKQDNNKKTTKQMVSSVHLNMGEILKPLPTKGTTNTLSENLNNFSVNSIDTNVSLRRKLVKQINTKEFESDTSSPFDNVELQTIDDMQELNDVFQAFNSKPVETKVSINDSHDSHDSHDSSDSSNRFDNCQTNHVNSDQSGSLVNNINSIDIFGVYSYQIPVNNTSSEQTIPNNWVQYNNDSKVNYSSNMFNDSTAAHLYQSQYNNLRSSKSASDLPTLLSSEESFITKRERSHTPPCYSSKTKNKKHINGRQTLILNDPFEELSQYSKDFVNSISSMGFERSRVARAVKHINTDDKKVLDFLLQLQTLEEDGYDCCEAEIALHMNNYQLLNV
jgi:hypothetical protein